MNNDILDEPIIENKLPPVNASTLLFIALTFIFLTPLIFVFLSFIDKWALSIFDNHIGEFISGTFLGESGSNFYKLSLEQIVRINASQGSELGVILGILLSIIFGFITKGRGGFSLAWKYMKSVFLLIIIGWILGALILQVVIDYNFVEVLPNPWLMGASIGKVTGSVIGVTYFTIKIYKGLKKFNFQ